MTFRSILELDARLSDRLRVAEKPGLLRALAVFFAHSGDSWFWGLGLILLWRLGDPFWKRWALVLFAAIAILAVIVLTVKFTVRRRRPEGEWGGIYRNTDPHSFPSGHAARAFLIAVLAGRPLCFGCRRGHGAGNRRGDHWPQDRPRVSGVDGKPPALVGLRFPKFRLGTNRRK
ncbi:MAG: hypothetical protein B6D40_13515 [Anaerolineae bacterium UTCFX3]|nr:MAG: hypothetical protein B6D40_13515 [Anaerolineae bacterium UTCFX3]